MVCVIIPVYWKEYGSTNFLWFLDIDIVLLLIDQLYTARNYIKNLARSISGQPQEVQNQIMMVIKQFINTDKTP